MLDNSYVPQTDVPRVDPKRVVRDHRQTMVDPSLPFELFAQNLCQFAWHDYAAKRIRRTMIGRDKPPATALTAPQTCLTDRAVDKKYQRAGIGKKLQIITQEQLGPKCKLILAAAPDVNEYYKKQKAKSLDIAIIHVAGFLNASNE